MEKEKLSSPVSGYMGVISLIVLITLAVLDFVNYPGQIWAIVLGLICIALVIFILPGFLVINPNESAVLVLFGAYKGTLKRNGFFWLNPFLVDRKSVV